MTDNSSPLAGQTGALAAGNLGTFLSAPDAPAASPAGAQAGGLAGSTLSAAGTPGGGAGLGTAAGAQTAGGVAPNAAGLSSGQQFLLNHFAGLPTGFQANNEVPLVASVAGPGGQFFNVPGYSVAGTALTGNALAQNAAALGWNNLPSFPTMDAASLSAQQLMQLYGRPT